MWHPIDVSLSFLSSYLPVATGFTVLFRGSKSDKLEYAFGFIDKDKDGKLSRRGL